MSGITESAIPQAGDEPVGRRRAVLRMLRKSRAPLSIVTIADELGIHANTVRFHLDSLVGDGQVQQVKPTRRGPGRPPLMFKAVSQMDRGGTRHYRMLAEMLVSGLAAEKDSSARAIAAGRAWGERLEGPAAEVGGHDAVDHLVDLLDSMGFEPERRAANGNQQLGLRHCPFLELAEQQASVVCPIHLGLMRGALETWTATGTTPVTVDRLEPFAEPGLCLAHLMPVGAPAQ